MLANKKLLEESLEVAQSKLNEELKNKAKLDEGLKRLELQVEIMRLKLEKEVADKHRLEESEANLKKELVELKGKLVELLQLIDYNNSYDLSFLKG